MADLGMGRARPERRSLVADRGVPLHHPRALGSTDFHTRQTAVRDLAAWLCSSDVCSREELLQLWKGLFYAFWHSDQADVQVVVSLCQHLPPRDSVSLQEAQSSSDIAG